MREPPQHHMKIRQRRHDPSHSVSTDSSVMPQLSSPTSSLSAPLRPRRQTRAEQTNTLQDGSRPETSPWSSTAGQDLEVRSYPTPRQSPETTLNFPVPAKATSASSAPGTSDRSAQNTENLVSSQEPDIPDQPVEQTDPSQACDRAPIRLASHSSIVDHGSPPADIQEEEPEDEQPFEWPPEVDPVLADWSSLPPTMFDDLFSLGLSTSRPPLPSSTAVTSNSTLTAAPINRRPLSFVDLPGDSASMKLHSSHEAVRVSDVVHQNVVTHLESVPPRSSATHVRTAPAPSTPSRGQARPSPYSTPSRSAPPMVRTRRHAPSSSQGGSDASSSLATSNDGLSLRSGPSSLSDGSPQMPAPVRKKKSHSRRMSEGHVPRPKNAFILYRAHVVADPGFVAAFRGQHNNISKVVGAMWQALPKEQTAIWHELAEEEKEAHAKQFPNYKYKPARPSPKKSKSDPAAMPMPPPLRTSKGPSDRPSGLVRMAEEDQYLEDSFDDGFELDSNRSFRSSASSRKSVAGSGGSLNGHRNTPSKSTHVRAGSDLSGRSTRAPGDTDQEVLDRVMRIAAQGLQQDAPTSGIVARMAAVGNAASRPSATSSPSPQNGATSIVYDGSGDIIVTPTKTQLSRSTRSNASDVSSNGSSPYSTPIRRHTRLAGFGSGSPKSSPPGSGSAGRPGKSGMYASSSLGLGYGRAPGSNERPPIRPPSFGQGILASTSDPSQLRPTIFDTSLLQMQDRKVSIGSRWGCRHSSRLPSRAERLAQQQELEGDLSTDDQFATVRATTGTETDVPWSAVLMTLDPSNCVESAPSSDESFLSPPTSSSLFGLGQDQEALLLESLNHTSQAPTSTLSRDSFNDFLVEHGFDSGASFHLGDMELFETPESALPPLSGSEWFSDIGGLDCPGSAFSEFSSETESTSFSGF
ncbi:BZ3500_MvSof-1268-A1-R1_Chr1-3g02374 [Microbotryum saponariae]|uniref:BZ3500_MvSof-1268-A1-R1_Chr1-3g02374 protein n=1 Tax=Microbotryum saponariae TaxID=289078 RepID=A0A2X0KX62_9BASI|nr:BZ3500_MvSof-1268-A1-R1_Chr1-3g02374 [Microbotryum saponariae]SCZ96145.1 BZ3501_MvSof-1269-A2-R1_Chr1-3g01977 [Microbotryum saponariae]